MESKNRIDATETVSAGSIPPSVDAAMTANSDALTAAAAISSNFKKVTAATESITPNINSYNPSRAPSSSVMDNSLFMTAPPNDRRQIASSSIPNYPFPKQTPPLVEHPPLDNLPSSTCNLPLPSSFYCPLTHSPMIDPVIDQEGNSYEKSAIMDWLIRQGQSKSPITKNPLKPYHLAVNRALKEAICEYMGEYDVCRFESAFLDAGRFRHIRPDASHVIIDAGVRHHHSKIRLAFFQANSSTPCIRSCAGPEWTKRTEVTSNRYPATGDDVSTTQRPDRTILRHASPYRTLVDDFLQEIGRTTPLDERLNEAGVCAFAYDGHTFVIEVPERSGVYLFYTSLGKLEDVRAKQAEKQKDVLRTLLNWNYLQKQTRGGVLSLDAARENDITFSYYGKVEDVNCSDFRIELERFMETSLRLYDKLHKEERTNRNGEVVRRKVDLGYRIDHEEKRKNSV